jgi:hypothetical protein
MAGGSGVPPSPLSFVVTQRLLPRAPVSMVCEVKQPMPRVGVLRRSDAHCSSRYSSRRVFTSMMEGESAGFGVSIGKHRRS